MAARLEIDKELCKSCGYCVEQCPKGVLAFHEQVNQRGYHYVYEKNPEDCIGCAVCAAICPDCVIEVYR